MMNSISIWLLKGRSLKISGLDDVSRKGKSFQGGASVYECLQNNKYEISVTSSIQIIFKNGSSCHGTIFCTVNIRHNSLPFSSSGASFFSSIPPTLSHCEPPLPCLLTLNHMLVNPRRFPPLIRLWDSSFPDISLTDSSG